ncbi:hypothetical protein [Paenibacillus sp. LHD-38]|uniref:hypothetical protein n=1 Tax=Paenibacillus sp. LHD-38 TaxID=3072143 RepID=UPI00280F2934|nr:hypothetical protein [Paenibacillus sp. LHD-38]MDQ8739226.1 hypothetical protein [Paenibacillus sp. LHD-38]
MGSIAGEIVNLHSNGIWLYDIKIPFIDLGNPPSNGTEWRWNLFQIDKNLQGERHYWAWSPTGEVQFHLPQYFGTLEFHR